MSDLELEHEDKRCAAHAIREKHPPSPPKSVLAEEPKEIFVQKYASNPGGSKHALDFFHQAISTPDKCPLLRIINDQTKSSIPAAKFVSDLILLTVKNYNGGIVFKGIAKAATKDEFSRVFAVTQTSRWWCIVVRSLEHIYSSLYHYAVEEKEVEEYFADSFENYVYMYGSNLNHLEGLVEKIKNSDRECWLGYANPSDRKLSNDIIEKLSAECDAEELSAYIFSAGVAKGCDIVISNYTEILLSLKEQFKPANEGMECNGSAIVNRACSVDRSEPLSRSADSNLEVDDVLRLIPNPWVSAFRIGDLYKVLTRSYSVYRPTAKISPVDVVSRASVYNFVESFGVSLSEKVVDTIALAFKEVPIFNKPRASRYPVLPFARSDIEIVRQMHRSMADEDGFPITLSNDLTTFTRHELFAFVKNSTAAVNIWLKHECCTSLFISHLEQLVKRYSKETPKPNYDQIDRELARSEALLNAPPPTNSSLCQFESFNPLPGILAQKGISEENINIFMREK
jgi:hypothetical protein